MIAISFPRRRQPDHPARIDVLAAKPVGKAGGRVDASRRWAADFELWLRFFRYAQICPVDALIGGFRIHGDSLGLQDMENVTGFMMNLSKRSLIVSLRENDKTTPANRPNVRADSHRPKNFATGRDE
jgi:hypothetical protein